MGYLSEPKKSFGGTRGRVARYAWGYDYHEILKTRLKEFVKGLSEAVGRELNSRIFVDDGPMNDRAAAERSGVAWFGKNTNVITPSHGSWVLLGQVITDLRLKPDKPLEKNCGTCVQCMVDCPTGAIVAPYVIDNTKCISFFTIELRGVIPREMRSLIGDWVFGCDICQEVCPPNRKVEMGSEPGFKERHNFAAPQLLSLLDLSDEGFQVMFRKSPIKRAKKVGLQRNVCVALGNIGDQVAVPKLISTLNNSEPLVRLHAAWALGKIGGDMAVQALRSSISTEKDHEVLEEIRMSLSQI